MNTVDFTSLQRAQEVAHLLNDKKAEKTVILDLTDQKAFADYMVISTALSGRQASALADYVCQYLKQKGIPPHVEGLEQCDWVLIDAGDVVVHIFKPDVRLFYNLEKMWGQTKMDSHFPSNP